VGGTPLNSPVGKLGNSLENSVVNCIAYSDGRRTGHIKLPDISELLKQPGQFIWIGLHEPSAELLAEIQEEFGLHDLAIEDAQKAHQRPKIEHYADSIFVVLRTIQMKQADTEGDLELEFGETHLFIGANYLVTVRHGSSLAHIDLRSRCESTPELLAQGPAFPLYALMDFIVDQYFPVLDSLEERLETLEEVIFEETFNRATSQRIYHLKREILEVKRAVYPLVDVCNQLVRFDLKLIPEATRPYFRDVYDHVMRINEMLDTLRELLTSALEANLAMVSVAQNEVTKQLAAWAAIIAVPTAIAGIYGMNFEHMPELKWISGYPFALALMLAFCLFLYWRFKRAGWL
jgi:magnesium transporter